MSCFHPREIKIDSNLNIGRSAYVLVPCGKCVGCKQDYTTSFAHRLMEEAKDSVQVVFVTLTYRPEFLPAGNVLVKKDLQNFLKRFNTKMRGYYHPVKGVSANMPYKYAACGEYGGENGRAHYHVLFFFKACSYNMRYPVKWEDIQKCWCRYNRKKQEYESFGRVQIELPRGEADTCAYLAKYSQKQLYEEYKSGEQPPFSLRSQGLGIGYLWRSGPDVFRRAVSSFKNEKGFRVKLHRYYLGKLYGLRPFDRSEDERRKLFLIRARARQQQDEYDAKLFREYILYHYGSDYGEFLLWKRLRLEEKERVALQRLADKEKKRKSSRRMKNFSSYYTINKFVYG